MKLYTNNQGEWAGTQADAKKKWGKAASTAEVPTIKQELIDFLNENNVGSSSPASTTASSDTIEAVAIKNGNSVSSPLMDVTWATGEPVILDLNSSLLQAKYAIDEIMCKIGRRNDMPKKGQDGGYENV
tara:strand:+ start:557 stop:943 length:387 start_codon:yes stop_codon:yes gene_type:complete